MALVVVDVVIPTYGGWEITRRCLQHLAGQTIDHRVIVADNASPDDTVERLTDEFPEVELVALPANEGFAAACNRGIEAGRGDVVVLLNNDVFVEPDFLERITAPLAADASLGSVAPLLLRPDGRIDSLGLCADPTIAGFPWLQGCEAAEATGPAPVLLGPSGGAAAYRRAALDDVGPFDERIFMYQEDLDLALRLRAAGWPSAAVTDARGMHLGSASAGRRSDRQRSRSGFARAYLLRAYGMLHRPGRLRVLVTELVVVAGDALLARDLAALRGRLAGWRAGAQARRRELPDSGIDRSIGLRESFRLRRSDYRVAGAAATPAHA